MHHTAGNPWDESLRIANAAHEDNDRFLGAYREAFSLGYRPGPLPLRIRHRLIEAGMGEEELNSYTGTSSANPFRQNAEAQTSVPFRAATSPSVSSLENFALEGEIIPDADEADKHYAKRMSRHGNGTQTATRINYDLAADAIFSDWRSSRISNSEVKKRLGQLRKAGYDVPEYDSGRSGWSYYRYMEARAKFKDEVKENASPEKMKAIDLANRRLRDPWAK